MTKVWPASARSLEGSCPDRPDDQVRDAVVVDVAGAAAEDAGAVAHATPVNHVARRAVERMEIQLGGEAPGPAEDQVGMADASAVRRRPPRRRGGSRRCHPD